MVRCSRTWTQHCSSLVAEPELELQQLEPELELVPGPGLGLELALALGPIVATVAGTPCAAATAVELSTRPVH